MSKTEYLLIGLVAIVLVGVFWNQGIDDQLRQIWPSIKQWFLPQEIDFTSEIDFLKELDGLELNFSEETIEELQEEKKIVAGDQDIDKEVPENTDAPSEITELEEQIKLLEIEQEIRKIEKEVEIISLQVAELVAARDNI